MTASIVGVYDNCRKIRFNQDGERKLTRMDKLMTIKKNIKKKNVLTVEDEKVIDEIENEITEEVADREYKKNRTNSREFGNRNK